MMITNIKYKMFIDFILIYHDLFLNKLGIIIQSILNRNEYWVHIMLLFLLNIL